MILLAWIVGICMSIGLVIGIIRRNNRMDMWGENAPVEQIFGWLFYGAVMTFIVFNSIKFSDREYTGDKTEHYMYIYSLKNKSDVAGSFFIGSGSISETEYYYFYYKSKYGFERHKLETHNVSIDETDDSRPRLVERIRTYKGKHFKWYDMSTNKYIMYVPKGTIIRQFRVY